MFPSLILIKRFFPAFISFLIFIFSLLAIFLFPSFLFFIFSFLSIFSGLFFLLILFEKETKKFWPYLVTFFLFISGTILFLIFIKNDTLKVMTDFLLIFLIFLFFEIIFRFLYEPRRYPIYSLENLSSVISLIALFLLLSSFFAIKTFTNFPFFVSLIFVFLITFWISYFNFWLKKLPNETITNFIVSLIILELFFTLNFLPTSFYINGLILIIFFFTMINLLKKEKEAPLDKKTIKEQVIFALVILILILILAKWR